MSNVHAPASAPATHTSSAGRPNLPWLSWARLAGIVAIVTIHVFGHLVEEWARVSTLTWQVANLVESASRFGVPLFVVVSGASLLRAGPWSEGARRADPSAGESTRDFFVRRSARIAIPLLVWTAFFLWFDRFMNSQPVDAYTFAQGYLWGRPYYHLYFLYVIAGLYLVTPFLRVFVANASRRLVIAAAVVCLTLASLDKLQHAWLGGGGGFNAFTYFVPWIGYYLLGFVIVTSSPVVGGLSTAPARRVHLIRWLGVYLGCTLVATAGTWWLFGRLGPQDGRLLYDYFMPTTILATIAVVNILRGISTAPPQTVDTPVDKSGVDSPGQVGVVDTAVDRSADNGRRMPLSRRLADLTFGVFLLHPIPLEFIRRHQPDLPPLPNLVFHSLTVVALLIGCGLATYLLRLVPVLRRLV